MASHEWREVSQSKGRISNAEFIENEGRRRTNSRQFPANSEEMFYGIGRDISYSKTAGSFGYGSVRPDRVNPSFS